MTKTYSTFSGRLVMLGCGSIGQAVLPLILRHIKMPRENISILTSDHRGSMVAAEYGIREEILPVTPENYREVLRSRLKAGDFLLNLSVDVSSVALIDVSSVALIKECREKRGERCIL